MEKTILYVRLNIKILLHNFLMLKAYIYCLKTSFSDLYRNWRVVITTACISTAGLFLIPRFSIFGIVGGFMAGLMFVAILSYYYYWIANCQHLKPLNFKELITFNMSMFSATINVAFIFFIASLIINSISTSSGNQFIKMAYNLILVLLLNPIPEVIYREQYDGITSIKESFNFFQKNYIEWLLPLIILYLPILIYSPQNFPLLLSQSNPLLPFLSVIQALGTTFVLPLILIIAHWYMLFRARLYDRLA